MKIIFYGYLVSVPGRVYHGIPLHYNFLLKNPQLAILTAQTDPPWVRNFQHCVVDLQCLDANVIFWTVDGFKVPTEDGYGDVFLVAGKVGRAYWICRKW